MNYTKETYYPLSEKMIFLGIHHMFPGLMPNSTLYKKIKEFIVKEYSALGTCVLCDKRELVNNKFPDLIQALNLPSPQLREVVLNETTVQQTMNFHDRPVVVFRRALPRQLVNLRKRHCWL